MTFIGAHTSLRSPRGYPLPFPYMRESGFWRSFSGRVSHATAHAAKAVVVPAGSLCGSRIGTGRAVRRAGKPRPTTRDARTHPRHPARARYVALIAVFS